MYLLFSGFHWGDTEPGVVSGSKRTKKKTYLYIWPNIDILSFSACFKKVCNLFKPNALSPHCPCSGPSGCCWAAPGYFSSHHEARQPYWPALRSAPSASWVTIHHDTLRKQNDAWEICHHFKHVRLRTSGAGDSFTHRALTDTLIIKKTKKNNLKTWLHGNKISIKCLLTCLTDLSASQSTH